MATPLTQEDHSTYRFVLFNMAALFTALWVSTTLGAGYGLTGGRPFLLGFSEIFRDPQAIILMTVVLVPVFVVWTAAAVAVHRNLKRVSDLAI